MKNNASAILLLAAGKASRMGQPKQLLPFLGKTLLQHTTEILIQSQQGEVLVVLGSYAKQCEALLSSLPVATFIHKDWEEGMGSSIAAGMKVLLGNNEALTQVIICLADQPFLTKGHVQQLVNAKNERGKSIVATASSESLGPPILFDSVFFPELLSLKGDKGAKKLLHQYPEAVTSLPFPAAAFDIDTPEQYQKALRQLEKMKGP